MIADCSYLHRAYRDSTGRGHDVMDALRPLWALAGIAFLLTAWIIYSPKDILNADPRAVYTLVGTLFSNVTVSIVLKRERSRTEWSTSGRYLIYSSSI